MSNISNPTRPSAGQSQTGQRFGSGDPDQSQGGTSTLEKAKEAASFIGEKAKAATTSAIHSAEEAASYVGKKADDGVHAVGSGLKSMGETVRHTAPQRDLLKDGMSAVADTLENTGKYLEEEGISGIAEDMTNLIRRNPIPSLFIGIGVGFLLGRALSSRS